MLYPPTPTAAVKESSLSPTARRLAAVYARFACFGHSEPTFRSKEFVKLIKEAGLETAMFNIRPPNRVDFVYTYACVHGPGGHRNNKLMSLEAFAFATKGVAHETGMAHEAVLAALEDVEPLLHSMSSDRASPMPVSSRLLIDLHERASGEDEYHVEKQLTSPIVRPGVLASYASRLSRRDAEQAALSMEGLHRMAQSPRSSHTTKRAAALAASAIEHNHMRSPRQPRETPEWTAYSEPSDRNAVRRMMLAKGHAPSHAPANFLRGSPSH